MPKEKTLKVVIVYQAIFHWRSGYRDEIETEKSGFFIHKEDVENLKKEEPYASIIRKGELAAIEAVEQMTGIDEEGKYHYIGGTIRFDAINNEKIAQRKLLEKCSKEELAAAGLKL